MSSIFGGKKTAPQAQQQPAISGLAIQTSAYGKCVPLIFGQNRASANLIGYWNFLATPHIQASGGSTSGGGKGGLFGGNQTNGSLQVTYTYSAALAFAVCEGPISGFGTVYADKQITTTAALGFTEFLGTYPQTAWTYLTTSVPADAYGYNGIAYLGASSYQMGSATSLPNHNFVVNGLRYSSAIVAVDADPSLVVSDLLTNAKFGVPGFSAWMGSLTTFQDYCFATGIFISPVYDTQQAANGMIDEIGMLTNSEPLYTAAAGFRLIPRGDEAITANGHTYTPPTPDYNLTDDDFLPDEGRDGSPISITRSRASDQINSVKLECVDRSAAYQKIIVEAKNQAAIDLYGLRAKGVQQAHMICSKAIGQTSAQLFLQRQTVRNVYRFKTDLRFMLVDPGDILTLTHSGQGLTAVGVKVRKIEKKGNEFHFTCEEYLAASGTAAAYSIQGGNGYAANYDVAPGNVNAPIIWEPTFDLSGAMEIWAAVSGATVAAWGGCDVWGSYDGTNYSLLTSLNAPTRMGVLTSSLAVQAGTVPTQDNTHTLAVNVSQSGAQLVTVSLADELAGNALCYVASNTSDGEYLSYRNAGLVGTGLYNLTNMLRGMYGTAGVMAGTVHPSGSKFARLDGRVAKIPYDQTRIGATLFLKFLSFNIYGRATQTLADVSPYSYTILGLLQGTTTVSGFVATATSVVSNNGGFNPAIRCDWTPITNTAAVAVLLEFYSAGSSSVLVSQEYCRSPASGTYTIIQGIQPNTIYFVRASIITDPSLLPTTFTTYQSVTTGSELLTTPTTSSAGVPTSLNGTAAIRNTFLRWTNPTLGTTQADPNVAYIEIWAATVNNRAAANIVGRSYTDAFVHSGLIPATTYYYWVRSISTGNVASNFEPSSPTAGVSVTTALINTPDVIANAITSDLINAGAVIAGKIGVNAIVANDGVIANLAVNTIQIAGNAITVPQALQFTTPLNTPDGFAAYAQDDTVIAPAGFTVRVLATVVMQLGYSTTIGAAVTAQLIVGHGPSGFVTTETIVDSMSYSAAPGFNLVMTGLYSYVSDGTVQTLRARLNWNGTAVVILQNRTCSYIGMKR